MGNDEYTIFKLQPQFTPGRNISFGGTKEKEMINTFNIFNILWYAPENSEKLEEWIAFSNVSVIKVTEENLFKSMILLGQTLRLVISTTGSYAEKSIPKIAEILNISVIIYCMDINYHKKWSQKYQIIRGVFTNPADIFDKLLELQKPYTFPLFSYKIINYDEFSFNYYDSLKNTELLLKERNFILKLNKYKQFCCLALYEFKLAYFLNEDFLDRFRSQTVEVVNFFYGESIFSIPGMDYYFANTIFDRPTKELNYFFMGLTLISVYFSKLPYLYGILNYEEIL